MERRGDHFFEGAWDGVPGDDRFDQATFLVGTGGRLDSQGFLFCTPSHPLEQLWTLRNEDSLYVSNSLVFALVASGEHLLPAYPGYFFDLMSNNQRGIDGPHRLLPTASGRGLRPHYCVNLLVSPNLECSSVAKNWGPPPRDFTHYRELLSQVLASIFSNAASPERSRATYAPITALSSGYDAAAVAVLAAEAGCREGYTYRTSSAGGLLMPDSGAWIGRQLGIETSEHDRCDLDRIQGIPGIEFFVNPFVTESNLASLESRLAGRLMLTGRHGELLWSPRARDCLGPRLQELNNAMLSGSTLTEFRLRVGMLNCPLPYWGAIHVAQLLKITNAREMQPWRLGGDYDRPIPRRILEEAGLPRGSFAVQKLGGQGRRTPAEALGQAAWRDFQEFLPSWRRQRPIWRRIWSEWSLWAQPWIRRGCRLPLVRRVLYRLFPICLHPRWGTPGLYSFAWGVSRLRSRYLGRWEG